MDWKNRIIKFLLVLLFVVASFSSVTKVALAQQAMVKSYIVIPSNNKDNVLMRDYMRAVESRLPGLLQEVQEWFSDTTGGKTFDFDPNVRVIVHQDPDQEFFLMEQMLLRLEFGDREVGEKVRDLVERLLPIPRTGEVHLVYIGALTSGTPGLGLLGLGIPSTPIPGACYGLELAEILPVLPRNSGLALIGVEPGSLFPAKHITTTAGGEYAKKLIAHELGHALGIVFSGNACGHPCTKESVNQCKPGTPPEGIAPAQEWYDSVMGYGAVRSPAIRLRDVGLNNTIINPELWELFQNPLINPRGDPAPQPGTVSTPQARQPVPEIASVSPVPVQIGEVLSINGRNFGHVTGKVTLIQDPDFVPVVIQAELFDWLDTSVRIRVNQHAEQVCVERAPEPGQVVGGVDCINIKTVAKPKPKLLSVDVSVTCGVESKPVEGQSVRLEQILDNPNPFDNDNYKELVTTEKTGPDGKVTIYLPILQSQQGTSVTPGRYVVTPEFVRGTSFNPHQGTEIIILDTSRSIERPAPFHYASCPGEVAPTPTLSPIPTTTTLTPTPATRVIPPVGVCEPGVFRRDCVDNSTCGCTYYVFQCTADGVGEERLPGTETNCDFAPPECNTLCTTAEEQAGQTSPTPGVPEEVPGEVTGDVGPAPKKQIVAIEVDGKGLTPREGEEITLNLLAANTSRAETISVPIVVKYSDGSSLPLIMNFNYVPPRAGTIGDDFCEISTRPGDAYTQCGGTTGLEGYDPSHTVFVKVKRNRDGEICGWDRQDLRQKPGECGNPAGAPAPATPAPQPAPVSEPAVADWCVRTECDSAIDRMVCIIRYTDGSEKVGEATNDRCVAACDNLYYFDPNVDQCIHKHSPNDPAPNCKYAFDWVDKSLCGM